MIDSSTETTATTVTVRAQPQSWRRSVRWFAAEFLLVVSGVLVALALQAWYQGQQNARAERVYIAQLRADLDTTNKMLRAAFEWDSTRLEAHARLVAALHRPEPLSPD